MVDSLSATAVTPLTTATGVYVCVHGHFYQPPRENPYLNAIERQPSAAPFQNWNERILYESYRPNAFARILDHHNQVVDIVNNYEYISFNIGPTLMSWLERHGLETYQRILEADRKSCERLGGHGNAIAQVYNHIILPLANQRDKVTQVRWGIADFRARFGREPEGIWLAETGVDYPTLSVLVQEGIKFTILAPSQAQRCRQMFGGSDQSDDWHEVGGGQIDPTRPYRCFLKEPIPGCDRNYIDLFFYDGPISRDMGFNDILSSSDHFAGRLGLAVRGDHRPSQLIAVATDGETFGHHRGGAEKALAYAVTHAFPEQGWTVTNFAHYLSLCPPTWEVELKPVTAWSCSHGVDRWQDDCGCGGGGDWNQQWRRPLRDALDWLRDQLIGVYETTAPHYFQDPWAARDDYARIMCDRSPSNVTPFLEQHQTHPLSNSEQVDALRLLEMQRHALLMYTSCGWFFDEISRPEGTQILRYASRALELAGEVAGIQLEQDFIDLLSRAPSNVDSFEDGAAIYHQLVSPSRVGLEQVAAHYAMSSLFNTYHHAQRLYCYRIHHLDYQLQRIGPLTLAVGQLDITSEITQEQAHLVFTVFHMGSWDFHCCIQPFRSRLIYTQAKTQLFEALSHASTAQVLLTITHLFGEQSYNLQNLFPEERHRIMQLLSQETLHRLDQLYTQVYRDNYGILRAFHRDQLSVPQELQVAAEIALGRRAMQIIQALEQDVDSDTSLTAGLDYLSELEATATEASHFNCQIKLPGAKHSLEQLILRTLRAALGNPARHITETDLHWIDRLIRVGNALNLGLSLDRAQEMYYQFESQQQQQKTFDPSPLITLRQLLSMSST